jgi:hypothetical protein
MKPLHRKVIEADGILYGLYVDAFSNMSDDERCKTETGQ